MCIYSHDNQTHDEFHHANAAAGKSYFAAIRHAISQYAPTIRYQHNPAVENVADYLLAGYQKYISTFFSNLITIFYILPLS